MKVGRSPTAIRILRNGPAVRVRNPGDRQPRQLYTSSSVVSATTTTQFNGNHRLHKPDWDRAVSEAEKIVGYPSSFLSLRWLFSDEIANIALHLRRMVNSNHPLLETVKGLLYNGQNTMQAWGLIVLLVSKAAGHMNMDSSADQDNSGVLRSQRALAEIAEMIRTSHLMHNGLINIYPEMFSEPIGHNDMSFGNKIGLLSGDYLLANSFNQLSILKNQNLMELISSALRDLSEAEFVGRRDSQNNPLPSPFEPLDRNHDSTGLRFNPLQSSSEQLQGDMPLTPALHDWTRRNVLSAGSLLGKSCQGALLLAGHGEQLQKQGFLFGKHLSLAWQAYLDLEPFLSDSMYLLGMSFNLTSAPVMFHLEHDSSLFKEIDKGVNSIQDVDYVKVHNVVINGPGINYTKQLQKEHSEKAMEILNVFEESDARTALSNIIIAMDRK
ncbi:decaprenyl-diphosphate synthase subunit 2-like [Rhopalosiphum maidis]|uniref:decaprenyl-diphosphate synthase subunit 2-like n=1 Tax=Rhopalosiphum maidis TaxID=43146 RepID=UPI000EFDD49B|nr:decaprenyl-diphosphate synthase subunit 2-like [Rhopalosiphum maidis]XP_026808296.1 decaprenyl-diphosphate synthase subunit 2-like [Rhopalosiphum maidis]XP_026808297.1 decaprenyl-diphosphate synthase subunit 2-like [Rhopalosiphum maidis]